MPDRIPTRFRRSSPALTLAVSALLSGAAVPALAQDTGASSDNNTIVASLNPVPHGLSCSDAAAQAQVSFDFQKPDFDIKQISLYVDGKGVPQESVNQQWPRVTLNGGLHAGRNTVEIVATGDNDRSIARQLTVLVGVPPKQGDESAAIVQCDDSRTEVAQAPEVVQPEDQVVEEAPPPTVVERTVYVDQPVYVYHDYPAYPVWPVFVPIIPVVIGYVPPPVWYGHGPYCPPPVVTYRPAPPPYVAPPVAYRQPPHEPAPTSNAWRTPNPITGKPMPIHGSPMPYQQVSHPSGGGVMRAPGGSHFSTAPSGDQRWGTVTDMNTAGPATRYRTPPPAPTLSAPHGGGVYQNTRGQQSEWVSAPRSGQMAYQAPPRQTYVHEMPAPHFEAPRPMAPPRMNSVPSFHTPAPQQTMRMPMQMHGVPH